MVKIWIVLQVGRGRQGVAKLGEALDVDEAVREPTFDCFHAAARHPNHLRSGQVIAPGNVGSTSRGGVEKHSACFASDRRQSFERRGQRWCG